MITSTTINGLKTTIFADEGMDEVLVQVAAVSVDCWFMGGKLVKVEAPNGISFKSAAGDVLTRRDGFNVTDLCDLAAITKQLREEALERVEQAMQPKITNYEFERFATHL